MKRFLLAASAIVILPHGAYAQTATTAAATPTEDGLSQADAGDIVVTANKREQRLQDTPQSITFVSEAQIAQQNINNINQLDRIAPSLTNNGGALKIRGLGAQTFSRSAEGSVGVVLDGVALGNASGGSGLINLFDVGRVEVLNGPQGTLFGRNSTAGVVNVVTNAPSTTRAEMAAHLEAGDRDGYRAQLMANLPLGDVAALRLTGFSTNQTRTTFNVPRYGWGKNVTTGGRGRLLIRPMDGLTLNIIGDYSVQDSAGQSWSVLQSTPGTFLTTSLAACGITPSTRNDRNCYGGERYSRSKVYGGSIQADVDLGNYTVTSITANRWYRDLSGGDSDNLRANILDTNRVDILIDNFSQEVRLTSPAGGTVEFVVGGYYFDGSVTSDGIQTGTLNVVPASLSLGQVSTIKVGSESLAGFGQATVKVADPFRIVIGARLERQSVSSASTFRVAPGALANFGSIAPSSGSYKDTDFSYRVGAQYDLTRDLMAYVTYTRGYKGAAINDQLANRLAQLIVLPEKPKAWEAGIKSTLLDGKLGFNVAIYRTDIENFQTQFYDPVALAYVYGNAPDSRLQGFELSALGRLSDALSVNAGLTYTDATYGGGYLVPCGPAQTAAQGCNTANSTFDASGRGFATVPRWKATLSGEARTGLGTDLEGYVQSDLVYTSRVDHTANIDAIASVPSRFLLGGRIGIRTRNDQIGFSIYGRNLLNQVTPTTIVQTPLATQLRDLNSHIQFFGAESFRSVGAAIDLRF